MSRVCRAWRQLTLCAAAAAAVASGASQAHEMFYDQDGYKLAVGIEAGLGGFAVGNADTAAGNLNTDASLTRGNGDATSSLAPQGARSTTSNTPQHAALEDAVIGWHSGSLFAGSLGEDAIELSGGQQAFVLGDSFLIGSGVVNGFGRAAFYLQPRASFTRTAILKLKLAPLRARLFQLENRVDQKLMQGFDQPKTDFFGLDIALFEPTEEEPTLKPPGQKQAPTAARAVQTTRVKKEVPDLWTAGFDFFHVYDADSTVFPRENRRRCSASTATATA
jgi:hypothetical protein